MSCTLGLDEPRWSGTCVFATALGNKFLGVPKALLQLFLSELFLLSLFFFFFCTPTLGTVIVSPAQAHYTISERCVS